MELDRMEKAAIALAKDLARVADNQDGAEWVDPQLLREYSMATVPTEIMALLAAYKETRRALENHMQAFWCANKVETQALTDGAVADARTELAQEAMQGRAE